MKLRLVLFSTLMAVGLCGAQQKSDEQKLNERFAGTTGTLCGFAAGMIGEDCNKPASFALLSLFPINLVADVMRSNFGGSIEEIDADMTRFRIGSVMGYLFGVVAMAIAQGKFNCQISVKC